MSQAGQGRKAAKVFNVKVAGVSFEGRNKLVEKEVIVGGALLLDREADNPADEFAVAITLEDGRRIGYVPREDAEDVSRCLRKFAYYVVRVKSLVDAGPYRVPIVNLFFYRSDQVESIADLEPVECAGASARGRASTMIVAGPGRDWVSTLALWAVGVVISMFVAIWFMTH